MAVAIADIHAIPNYKFLVAKKTRNFDDCAERKAVCRNHAIVHPFTGSGDKRRIIGLVRCTSIGGDSRFEVAIWSVNHNIGIKEATFRCFGEDCLYCQKIGRGWFSDWLGMSETWVKNVCQKSR